MENLEDLTCVLFNGPSASGKTQTAKGIAAPQGLIVQETIYNTNICCDYKSLASPLAEMFNIKVDIQGADSVSRKLWMLHQVLIEIFPPNSVDFEDLMELLYDIASYPLNLVNDKNGNIVRDRDFMTSTADACHALKPNLFADHLVSKIFLEFKKFQQEHDDAIWKNVVIIPDLRLMPELESFERMGCNLIKIRFDLSDSVQQSRMIQRDVNILTESQLSHPTQNFKFKDSIFDLIIRSDDLTLEDQISMVKNFILNSI